MLNEDQTTLMSTEIGTEGLNCSCTKAGIARVNLNIRLGSLRCLAATLEWAQARFVLQSEGIPLNMWWKDLHLQSHLESTKKGGTRSTVKLSSAVKSGRGPTHRSNSEGRWPEIQLCPELCPKPWGSRWREGTLPHCSCEIPTAELHSALGSSGQERCGTC